MKTRIYPPHEKINNVKNVKFGIDPTGARLHLGHFVAIRYLQKLAKEGKNITIVLGTFTAQLGDPTGTEKTRPMLASWETTMNATDIMFIIKKYLPDATFFRNEDVADRMTAAELMREMSHFTLARISARDSFKERESIGFHELAVPLMQAMDSVHLHAEIEVGGEDQLFNFEIARELQKKHGQRPATCVLLPILTGTNGKKMSKSLDNCIYLDEDKEVIRQKCMGIPDTVMDEWIPILTELKELPEDPLERKKLMTEEILKQL